MSSLHSFTRPVMKGLASYGLIHPSGFSRLKKMQIPALLLKEKLPAKERIRVGNFFRSSLWQRQSLAFYWCPSERNITSRASPPVRLPNRKLPANSFLVGNYIFPCHESHFLDALIETAKSADAESGPQCS